MQQAAHVRGHACTGNTHVRTQQRAQSCPYASTARSRAHIPLRERHTHASRPRWRSPRASMTAHEEWQ
eukprot:8366089-Alexandrium_andersonii.AAC.1